MTAAPTKAELRRRPRGLMSALLLQATSTPKREPAARGWSGDNAALSAAGACVVLRPRLGGCRLRGQGVRGASSSCPANRPPSIKAPVGSSLAFAMGASDCPTSDSRVRSFAGAASSIDGRDARLADARVSLELGPRIVTRAPALRRSRSPITSEVRFSGVACPPAAARAPW